MQQKNSLNKNKIVKIILTIEKYRDKLKST